MAGPGHVTTTRIAIECLPAWQRDIWRTEEKAMAEKYAWYGDTYYTNRKELGPYVELWDGSTPGAFEGVRERKNYGHEIDYWESFFMDYWEKVFTYYTRRISDWLAAGDVHSAAQCAGTVSHWIADIGFPMHVDLPYVMDFFPPPPDIQNPVDFESGDMEPAPCSIADYRPRLLGLTPEEAGINILTPMAKLAISARGYVVPMLQAGYEHRIERIKQLLADNVVDCAKVLADFLYTVACLATQRFDDPPDQAMRHLSLTWRWPLRMSAYSPGPYETPVPMQLCGFNLDNIRRRVPCALLVRGKAQQFDEALGAGAYFEYHFRLAAKTYRRFTARVGIHASLGARRNVDAEVKLDGQTAFKGVLIPGKEALEVDIDAGGCRDIQLISSGPRYFQPDGTDNHVVWAQPRMERE